MTMKKALAMLGSILIVIFLAIGILSLVRSKDTDNVPEESVDEFDWIIPEEQQVVIDDDYVSPISDDEADAEGIAVFKPSQTRDNYGREIPDLGNTKTAEEIANEYQDYVNDLPKISDIDWTYSKVMEYPVDAQFPSIEFLAVVDEWGANIDPLELATSNTHPISLDFQDDWYDFSMEPMVYTPGYGSPYMVLKIP